MFGVRHKSILEKCDAYLSRKVHHRSVILKLSKLARIFFSPKNPIHTNNTIRELGLDTAERHNQLFEVGT